MATLVAANPSLTGGDATLVSASPTGDQFQNSGTEVLRVRNVHATAPRTITVDSPGTCSFGLAANAAHDAVIVVAANTEELIGPFPTGRFNTSAGMVVITYSDAAADLKVGVTKR
jgi:hypothetical protein